MSFHLTLTFICIDDEGVQGSQVLVKTEPVAVEYEVRKLPLIDIVWTWTLFNKGQIIIIVPTVNRNFYLDTYLSIRMYQLLELNVDPFCWPHTYCGNSVLVVFFKPGWNGVNPCGFLLGGERGLQYYSNGLNTTCVSNNNISSSKVVIYG